jgi:hypothetical protein
VSGSKAQRQYNTSRFACERCFKRAVERDGLCSVCLAEESMRDEIDISPAVDLASDRAITIGEAAKIIDEGEDK